MLEFTGANEIDRSREELWPYFTDTDVLADCIPGCSEITLEAPHEFTTVMSVGVGSVKPEFDVDVIVTEADYPETLEMRATGRAPRNEFETVASMNLVERENEEATDEGTTVEWSATADVSGTIASLGGRALKSVTNKLVQNFFDDLDAKVEEGVDAESELEAAPDGETSIDAIEE